VNFIKIFLFLFILPTIAISANLKEGELGIEDSKYLRSEINKFFYDGNSISSQKLSKLQEKIERYKKEEINNMIENLQTEGLTLAKLQNKV
jgi:hypothetical protein